MKFLRNKYLNYLFFIFPSVLAVLFFSLFLNKTYELDRVRGDYQNNIRNYEKIKKEFTAKNKKESGSQTTNIKSEKTIYLYRNDVENMKGKGLVNPAEDIISDLKEHRELIPYKGVLGGTMDFYGRNIWILTNKWVLAYFEDGHTVGYMLLEYSINDNGKITWKRISAMRG